MHSVIPPVPKCLLRLALWLPWHCVIIQILFETSTLKPGEMLNIYTAKINSGLELKEKRVITVKEKVKIINRKVCEKNSKGQFRCKALVIFMSGLLDEKILN